MYKSYQCCPGAWRRSYPSRRSRPARRDIRPDIERKLRAKKKTSRVISFDPVLYKVIVSVRRSSPVGRNHPHWIQQENKACKIAYCRTQSLWTGYNKKIKMRDKAKTLLKLFPIRFCLRRSFPSGDRVRSDAITKTLIASTSNRYFISGLL